MRGVEGQTLVEVMELEAALTMARGLLERWITIWERGAGVDLKAIKETRDFVFPSPTKEPA